VPMISLRPSSAPQDTHRQRVARFIRALPWGMFVVLIGGLSPACGAGTPVAILMSVSGETNPALSAMEEIAAGVPINLTSGTQLTFLLYAQCRLVTVVGGTLTLNRMGFTATGSVTSQRNGPCPTIHALSAGAGATSGGMLMRQGVGIPVDLPIDPDLIFVGNRAGAVASVYLYEQDHPDAPLLRFNLYEYRATLPADHFVLDWNTRYSLQIRMSDQPTPLELNFIAAARKSNDVLVLLRID
jgi:hypothetical protein